MQQTFVCFRCGASNYMGQASCWSCHQRFQYNCPYCKALIDPVPNCPYCGATLPWQVQQPAGYQPSQPQAGYSNIQSGAAGEVKAGRSVWRSSWIIGAVCLVLGAAITLAVVNIPGVFKTMNQSQPPIQTSQPGHQSTGTVDNEF